MFRSLLAPLVALLSASVLLWGQALAWADDKRIVAIGDVHGDIDAFRGILKAARLINDAGRWSGGAATFVQTGDLLDRGANVRAVMDLLMGLEHEAKPAGGRVEVLLGNHEGMNLIGFLRDANPAAYASFADDQSERRRAKAYDDYAKLSAARAKVLGQAVAPYNKDRDAWMAAHPPGYVEYREALGRDGRYGRWLRARNPVVQIGDTIFLHGGISPSVAADSRSIRDINDRIRGVISAFDEGLRALVSSQAALPFFTLQEAQEAALIEWKAQPAPALRDVLLIEKSWLLDPDGPLWFRGYANWTQEEGAPQIGPILDKFKARRIVVGHTPMTTGRITARFDDRVVLIDTGMLTGYFTGGRASALEIVAGRLTPIYTDEDAKLKLGATVLKSPGVTVSLRVP